MLSRDKRLPLDTWNASGPQENGLVINFLHLIRPPNHYQGIHHSTTPGATGSVPVHIGTTTLVARGEDQNADICKKAVDHEFIIAGGDSAEFYDWTAKTANIGTAAR